MKQMPILSIFNRIALYLIIPNFTCLHKAQQLTAEFSDKQKKKMARQ
jgi:hypothetical protein